MTDGTAQAIRLTRERLGLTQADAAEGIGLSLRQYSDIENERVIARKSHHMAMQLLSLKEAVRRKDYRLATNQVASLAHAFASLE